MKTKRIVLLAVFCAMALTTFMIENLFPPLFVPGAKMGLANVFVLLAILLLSPTDALVVVIVKTTLGCLFANPSAIVYSLVAGLCSWLVMVLLVEFLQQKLSVIAISICSAVCHNIAQLLVFCAISQTPQMIFYLPHLTICGVVAGIIVGIAVFAVVKVLSKNTLLRMLNYENFSN